MVSGSIRLAWMVFGWFVCMLEVLGGTGPVWVVSGCFEVISGGFGGIRFGLW